MRKIKATIEEKQRWYSMLLWCAKDKGISEGWAAHKYREKFKCWPRQLSKGLIEPDTACKNWIKSRMIRYASRNNKERETA